VSGRLSTLLGAEGAGGVTGTSAAFRVGFVGAGAIAGVHLDAVTRVPGAVLVGVTDRDGARAQAFAARARGVRAFPHLAAMVAAGVGVVHVLTPPDAHAAVALEALERGCDVLVEKPLATSDADCARLAETASLRGRRLGVNHSLLADPHVRHVLEAVTTGRVGEPIGAEFFCSAAYPPWQDGPLPPHYRDGGNPFRDLGVHGLYLLRAVLGDIEGVEPIFSSRGGDPNLCFDEWDVGVRCARGLGHLRLSWNARPLQTVFTVHATGGTLRADVGCMFTAARRATALPHAIDRAAGALGDGWSALRSVPANGLRWLSGRLQPYAGLRRAVEEFYAALAEGTPLPASLEDGRCVVRWVETVARPADAAKVARGRRHRPCAGADALVTGATGRLGTRLVEHLVTHGHRVRALCRRPPAHGPLRHPQVDIVLGDLGDAAAVDAAVAGMPVVYHAGAAMRGPWAEHARGTVAGTRHVVASALRHRVTRLVYVGSLSVLHWSALDGAEVTEAAPLEPRPEARGHYTRAKLLAEQHVLESVREHGLPAVIVRPGVLVGPHGPGLDALNAVVIGRQLVLLGTAAGTPPLIDVDDAAALIVRAGYDPALEPGTIVHVVGSQSATARALARRFGREHGLRVRRLPGPLLRAGAAAVAALARALGRAAPITPYRVRAAEARLRFDCTRARTVLGWACGATGATEPESTTPVTGPPSGAPAAVT
jgi:predicted dehydrogenase/nucleoside-diphosphate-sugar epimerase